MNDRHFSSCEVVELGIQIEKNGRDFYSALAGSTRNARAAEIFKYLAGEEEKHIAVSGRYSIHLVSMSRKELALKTTFLT